MFRYRLIENANKSKWYPSSVQQGIIEIVDFAKEKSHCPRTSFLLRKEIQDIKYIVAK